MVPSAGKNTTRIFLSSMVPFAIFSTFCHYDSISAVRFGSKELTNNSCDIAHFSIWAYRNRLHQEFVAAPEVWRRVFSHRLKKNYETE